MTKHPLPKNKREYAAALKRAKASAYRRAAKHIEQWTGKTSKELADELRIFAGSCDDDARYAETGPTPNLDRLLREALGD